MATLVCLFNVEWFETVLGHDYNNFEKILQDACSCVSKITCRKARVLIAMRCHVKVELMELISQILFSEIGNYIVMITTFLFIN